MTPEVCDILRRIRHQKPFVLIITNYFPMHYVASSVHSIGAIPLMCDAEQELGELLELSRAVIINLGKLDNAFIKLSNQVCTKANQMNIPVTIDTTGADVSEYRAHAAINLIKNHHIAIINGYPHEVISLLTGELIIQETHHHIDESLLIEHAKYLSKKHNTTVAISGKKHIITNSDQIKQFYFDSDLAQKVAGINNLLSAIISTFSAVEKDPFVATMNATHFYADCVGPASSDAPGPASLITKIIDHLYINASKVELLI